MPLANEKNRRDNCADSPGFSKWTMTYLREKTKQKNNLEPFFSISTSLIPFLALTFTVNDLFTQCWIQVVRMDVFVVFLI